MAVEFCKSIIDVFIYFFVFQSSAEMQRKLKEQERVSFRLSLQQPGTVLRIAYVLYVCFFDVVKI